LNWRTAEGAAGAPAAIRPVFIGYYRAMSELAQVLMWLFALGLGLEESFFDAKIDRHISRLRLRNYPAQLAPPLPGQLRAGAHSNYGSLTILATEDRPAAMSRPRRRWPSMPSDHRG
jgi:isopenicillin N synthase-like dioxygenase